MFKHIDKFEEYALLILFPLMVVVVFTATMARYLNLFPMFWGEELARYIMVYLAYIAAGLGMKWGSHISVGMIIKQIKSKKIRRAFDYLRILVILGFCGTIVVLMSRVVVSLVEMKQTSPALHIPIWIVYAAIPFGMILVGIRAIQAFIIATKEIKEEEGE